MLRSLAKFRTALSPAIRSAQLSVKSAMLRKEKLPLEAAAQNVTSEIPIDDLDVPAFLRRGPRREVK